MSSGAGAGSAGAGAGTGATVGVGVLVGVIYALLRVRSPAPPAIALIGLLGILIGEQLVPVAVRMFRGEPVASF
ncbi:MAG: hypothetical protein B7X32_15850, partial [Microbacterium sp. 13-71-7]